MATPRPNPSGDARWDIGPEGEVAQGIRCRWNDKTRIIAIETHYTADPEKRSVEWFESESAGSKNWEVEYELAWRHYSGKAVYGATFGEIHVAKSLPYDPKRDLLVGWDFGRDPCAIFGQLAPDGQLRIIGEALAPDRMSMTGFAPYYMVYVADRFGAGAKMKHVGDPSGWNKGQNSEEAAVDVLKSIGVHPQKGEIKPSTRINNVEHFLRSLVGAGQPGFQIAEDACPMLLEGFRGGYCYPKIHTQSGTVQYARFPDKNAYSHPHDALQYLCGMARRMLIAATRPNLPPPTDWRRDWAGRPSLRR